MDKARLQFTVGEDFPKVVSVKSRLDKAITELIQTDKITQISQEHKELLSRTVVSNALQEFVRINDKVEKNAYKLEKDDVISIDFPKLISIVEGIVTKRAAIEDIVPEEGFKQKIKIVEENDDFIVIIKPHGIPVHPGVGNESGTIANMYKGYLMSQNAFDLRLERAGIVHRLDKSVGGLMILAKTYEAQKVFKELFESHNVTKVYKTSVNVINIDRVEMLPLPIMSNSTEESMIKEAVKVNFGDWMRVGGYIGRSHSDRKKMKFLTDSNGDNAFKEAVSYVCKYDEHIYVSIKTGRTHQIRATLEYLGYQIIGDKLYGSRHGGSPSSINSIDLDSVYLSFEFKNNNHKYSYSV